MARRRVAVAAVAAAALLLTAAGCGTGGPTPAASTTPASRVLVSDRFDRSVTDGWGSAEVGGAWESAAPTALSVEPGRGAVALTKPGTGGTVSLVNPQPADALASLDVVAPDTAPLGSGLYVGLQLRTSGGSYYRCKVRFTAGVAFLSVVRQDAGVDAERVLVREHKVAEKVKAGQVFRLSCESSGTDVVHLASSALRTGDRAAWQVQGDDPSASRLITGGPTAVWSYLSGSAKTPLRVEYAQVTVSSLGDGVGPSGPSSPTPSAQPGSPSASPAASAPAGTRATTTIAWAGSGSRTPGRTAYAVPDGALHVSPVSGPGYPDGSAAAPFPTLASAVLAAGDGATLVLHRGTYHESVVLPREKRLTVQTAPGETVWLDGSSPVTRWRRSGGVWVSDGWSTFFDASHTYTRGAPEDDRPGWRFVSKAYPMAAHPDQVWVDGRAQRQVGARGAVGAGSFYVDRTARQLVLGTDPARGQVRASTLSTALTVLGEGDVVRGLGIRRYATSVWQLGVLALNVPHLDVSDVVVSDNATTGISVIAADVHLERVTATRNGLMGIHVNEADRLVGDSLLVSHNNLEHFNRAPSAGGLKMTRSADVDITSSQFVDNLGHGFWCDISCDGVRLLRSRFARNTGSGVVYEISRGLLLAGSVVADNRGEGLWLIDSDQLEVAANAVLDNGGSAVRLAQDDRFQDAGDLPWKVADVSLYGNVVRGSRSRSSLLALLDYTKTLDPRRIGLQLGHNVYQQRDLHPRVSFAAWTRADGGSASVPDLVAFQSRWGQDQGSLSVAPEVDLTDSSGRSGPGLAEPSMVIARELSAAARAVLGVPAGVRVLGPALPAAQR